MRLGTYPRWRASYARRPSADEWNAEDVDGVDRFERTRFRRRDCVTYESTIEAFEKGEHLKSFCSVITRARELRVYVS